MSDSDRPGIDDFIEVPRRTRRMGDRPLAPELVETPAIPMRLVTELRGKAARVEMRSPGAVVVNQTVVGKQRPAVRIDFRQLASRRIFEDGSEQNVRVRRTTGKIHDRLVPDQRVDADGTGRIGAARWDATPRGAGTDGDDGGGVRRHISEQLRSFASCDLEIRSRFAGRNRSFDDEHVLAVVLFHRIAQRSLGIRA